VNGDLGKLTIRGSLFGALDAVGDPATGQILVMGKAGPIKIGRDVFGAVSEQKALDLRGDAGAITIGVGAFDEFGETCARIAASLLWAAGRPAGLTAFRRRTFAFAFLSTGEAGQAQDSEAVDE
jgi:hypothetical protein